MNINRHNYEEFFLLYLDNELTLDQRLAVESFVQQNADLAGEFTLLQQSVLREEEIVFTAKEALHRTGSSINQYNYEEYFLLYAGNELNEKSRLEVERFVLQNPQTQDSFILVQKTKLTPEVIEYKNKQLLHKKEQGAKVIYFTPLRMAISAAIIAFVTMLWTTYTQHENIQQNTATFVQKTEPENTANSTIEKTGKPVEPATDNLAVKKKRVKPIDVNTVKKSYAEDKAMIAVTEKVKPVVTTADRSNLNNLPAPEKNDVFAQQNNSGRGKSTTTETSQPAILNGSQAMLAGPNAKSNESLIVHASYKEIDTRQDDEDQTLYVGGVQINKSKLRGLFKKAATLIDKRIKKPEIERSVQIAGYEITTSK